MGEAKRKAEAVAVLQKQEHERRVVHATKIVAAFEKFIDACIVSHQRQWLPEAPSPEWDINTLHDARKELVNILVIPPSDY